MFGNSAPVHFDQCMEIGILVWISVHDATEEWASATPDNKWRVEEPFDGKPKRNFGFQNSNSLSSITQSARGQNKPEVVRPTTEEWSRTCFSNPDAQVHTQDP